MLAHGDRIYAHFSRQGVRCEVEGIVVEIKQEEGFLGKRFGDVQVCIDKILTPDQKALPTWLYDEAIVGIPYMYCQEVGRAPIEVLITHNLEEVRAVGLKLFGSNCRG